MHPVGLEDCIPGVRTINILLSGCNVPIALMLMRKNRLRLSSYVPSIAAVGLFLPSLDLSLRAINLTWDGMPLFRQSLHCLLISMPFYYRLKGYPLLSTSDYLQNSTLRPPTIRKIFFSMRGEAGRALIIVALVLVPIAVLFAIFFTAIACSEYWSLRKERKRLFSFGRGHKRSRSDPSSSSSTRRTDSSDGDPELYGKAVELREHV